MRIARAGFLALSIATLGFVLPQQSCNIGVSPPGSNPPCPITFRDPLFIASATVDVAGPGNISRTICEVQSRTEFRARINGFSGPGVTGARPRFGVIGANYNGAPCAVTSPRWVPNSRFEAATLPCATPGPGIYRGDITLDYPVLGFEVRSSF